ncbi:DNA polymerase III subunit gamma and tau [Cellulosimicrobium sp. 4261]|uniref:DNA polymerase III subunit gamma and tau n=1 Tax=Cellulosimicrobium sp. 4261 TaxID=3156458 RepID=UPI003392F3D1
MSTALYRRYRPETFAEVIGQDHVTAPLMQALRSGRVNHAYLFSGPRGCGKTTSARILARTLNCERNTPESPLDTPCGQCPSCVELARGGPGSLDVVEIDAASHNGVDDARELRERAAFAPARDRYKIFILDEAHMVTPQGFNALLKLVEEPPEHVKFVFATTEPDKVIGTIRSRTHHYPFRLVPPDVLGPYLEELCAAEGVAIGSGVVPLVTRAGGGSVRDSLSVMDQLIAGAEDGAVEYERAVALLGFTHATLLDDVVDALAARDGASIFRVVDHVIATGHEPRRFVEDVLERLRDLIVIAVSGDEAQAVLRDQPADQLERMRTQAQHLGVAELSRAADLVNAALTEMTGATSPRLHLELLMARLLLPGADDGAAGFAARLDRLERGGLGNVVVPPAAGTPAPGDGAAAAPAGAPAGAPSSGLTGAAAVRAALRPARPAQAAAALTGAPVAQDPTPVGRVEAPSAPEQDRPSGDAAASPAADGVAASAADGAERTAGQTSRTDPPAPGEATAPAEVPVPERTGPAHGGASARPRTAADRTTGSAPDTPTGSTPGAGPGSAPDEASASASDRVDEAPAERARDTAAPAAVASRAPEGPRQETSREEAPREEAPRAAASHEEAAAPSAPAAGGASAALTTEELRRRWPEVLENLRASPVTWSLVSANAQVAELGADVLYLAFPSPGLARTFSSSRHTSAVQDVVYQTLGLQVRVEPRLDEGGQAGGGSAPSSGPAPASPAPSTGPAPAPAPAAPVPGAPAPGTAATAVAAGPAASGPAGSASASTGAAALHGPGGAQAGVPVATVAAPSAPGVARSASTSRPAEEAAEAHGTPRAAVALQERPSTETAPAAPPAGSTVVDAADEAWLAGASAPTPAPESRADSADEAWLAGLPAEPPADLDDGPEPEPVLEPASAPTPTVPQTSARTAAPAAPAPGRPGAATPAGPRQEAPARTAAPAAPASSSAAPLRGVSAARAAIAAARVPRTEEPARRGETSAVDPMDDLPSADDPDIVSTGLVGTALVVSLLDGKIIEEIQDQG